VCVCVSTVARALVVDLCWPSQSRCFTWDLTSVLLSWLSSSHGLWRNWLARTVFLSDLASISKFYSTALITSSISSSIWKKSAQEFALGPYTLQRVHDTLTLLLHDGLLVVVSNVTPSSEFLQIS
jgi:hypothetical protein